MDKVEAAKRHLESCDDSLRRYFLSDYTDDAVRAFLLKRVERAEFALRRARAEAEHCGWEGCDWCDCLEDETE